MIFRRLQVKESEKTQHIPAIEMEHETDEAILRRVGQGDEAALGIVHDRFAPWLYPIARRILGEGAEAEAGTRDGFLQIWEKAAEFDPSRGKAFPWIVMTFRGRLIDRLRAGHRRLRLREMAGESLPESQDGAEEDAQAVRRAVRSLPEEQMRCIEWAFLCGFTYLQLADVAGSTPAAVKTNVRRGMMRLRDALRGGFA